MLRRTELTHFIEQAQTKKRVLVYEQLPGDTITPISAAAGFLRSGRQVSLLESGETVGRIGRYSFLGCHPQERISVTGDTITVHNREGKTHTTGDPFVFLRQHQQQMSLDLDPICPGFIGGYVGYVSYDAVRYFEAIPQSHDNTLGFPDIYCEYHSEGVVFDHEKGVLTLLVVVEPRGDLNQAFEEAQSSLKQIQQEITQPVIEFEVSEKQADVVPELDDDAYAEIVKQCQASIRKGDAFQIVPSRAFSQKLHKHPFSLYRSLRFINPSPYMFYLETPFGVILGASPEKLVSAVDGVVETIPLAGTKQRRSVETDDAIAEELLSNEKEMAEHTMLVDLGRNDLGKVCAFGTVRVEQFATVLRFSHVMHIASIVRGTLRDDCDGLDALQAVFPAGTLSGAPKVRAMELIDSFECSRRGPYGGAIIMLDPNGNLDACIAIRMAVVKDGVAHMRAGAGVVMDSVPQHEAKETWMKVQVLLDAIDA